MISAVNEYGYLKILKRQLVPKMGWKSILFLVARCRTCGKLFGETEDFVKILIIENILILEIL